MHSLKSIFAFIAFIVGTALLIWGVVLTQVPWEPTSLGEAVAVLATIFGTSLGLLSLSWFLVRRARVDILADQPSRWRATDAALCAEAAVCSLLLLYTFSALLR